MLRPPGTCECWVFIFELSGRPLPVRMRLTYLRVCELRPTLFILFLGESIMGILKFIKNFFNKVQDNTHLNFEHRCCFAHQIHNIAGSSADGVVTVAMRSGKTAIYELTSEQYSYTSYTGQRNWYYRFIEYTEN